MHLFVRVCVCAEGHCPGPASQQALHFHYSDRNWWWVPVVAPILGGYLGAIIYLFFIGLWIPQKPKVLENNLGDIENKTPVVLKSQPTLTSTISPFPERTSEQLQESIQLEQF